MASFQVPSPAQQRLFFFVLFTVAVMFAPELGAQNAKRPIEGIKDNSFLIEEAYNQEPGAVQHVFTAHYVKYTERRGWSLAFAQEWSLFSEDHQFSYAIPFSFIRESGERQEGIEDLRLFYRYQALQENDGLPALAPRVGLILPTGSRDRNKGNGTIGYAFGLPVSKTLGDRLAFHLNAGLEHLPRARTRLDNGRLSRRRSLLSSNLGASTVYALAPSFHFIVEWLGEFEESIHESGRVRRQFQSIVSPGLRTAVFEDGYRQAVVGVAAPLGTNAAAQDYGVFLYFSLEHKFLQR